MKSNIKWLITKSPYKQYEVAKIMGVSDQALNSWIRCGSYPPIKKAVKLAKLLGCTLNDLYEVNWRDNSMEGKTFEELCEQKVIIPDTEDAFKDSENGTKFHFDFGEGKPKYDFVYEDGNLIPTDKDPNNEV